MSADQENGHLNHVGGHMNHVGGHVNHVGGPRMILGIVLNSIIFYALIIFYAFGKY